MVKVVTVGESVKSFLYFLLSSSFSPDFDLPSFSSQALSQVKDSHYQVVQYFNFALRLLPPDVSQSRLLNGLVRSFIRPFVCSPVHPSVDAISG